MRHDAIVIGSEADGVSAALTAASAGLDVALVDTSGLLGPHPEVPGALVSSLLHDAILEIRAAHQVLERDSSPSDLRDLFSRSLALRRSEAVDFHFAAIRQELEASRVQVLPGTARFVSANEIEITPGGVREARIVVVATGSRLRRPDRFPIDHDVVCDMDSIVRVTRVPRDLVVVGADVAGCEFSCMFAALGAKVTLIDRRRSLLRFLDAELREILHSWMQTTGVTVVLEEGVTDVEVRGAGAEAHAVVSLESGRAEVSDKVLVAAGSVPRTAGLGLAEVGLDLDPRGHVSTDERFRTSLPGIYAVGGVVDALSSVATRVHQGRLAMLDAVGVEVSEDECTPLVIETIPEIATVGLSAEACERLDLPHVVGSAMLGRVLRSRIRGEAEGILKLVIDAVHARILGVQVIGMSAREIINLGAAVIRREGTLHELASVSLCPGSLSEAYHEAALDALEHLGT